MGGPSHPCVSGDPCGASQYNPITSSRNAHVSEILQSGWGELPGSDFDGSGATPGWWADVLWVVGIGWLIAGGQMPDGSLFFVWRM